MSQISYQDRLKQIAALSHSGDLSVCIIEYIRFRGDKLIRDLRSCTPETLEKIQGKMDENDKLMELAVAIRDSKLAPPPE